MCARSEIDIDQLQISQQDLRILEILANRYKQRVGIKDCIQQFCKEQRRTGKKTETTEAQDTVGRRKVQERTRKE